MANKRISKIDSLINRWFSKKLIVFLISTILLLYHIITADQWFYIAMLYIGAQHFHDVLINFKHDPLSSIVGSSEVTQQDNK